MQSSKSDEIKTLPGTPKPTTCHVNVCETSSSADGTSDKDSFLGLLFKVSLIINRSYYHRLENIT